MALVDRDGVYGSPRFHLAAKKAGIRAHIGAEITCTDGFQYPLLVENRTGYQNLCRLVTRMKLRAKKGEGSGGTGGIGGVCEGRDLFGTSCYYSRGDAETSATRRNNCSRLIDIFGRANVFAEIQRHMNREEEARNQAQIAAARRMPCRWWPPMGSAMPRRRSARRSMCSPAFEIMCTLAAAGRLLAMNNETASEIRGGDVAAVCRSAGSHRQHAGDFRAARVSRSPISATNFRAIPCHRAKP